MTHTDIAQIDKAVSTGGLKPVLTTHSYVTSEARRMADAALAKNRHLTGPDIPTHMPDSRISMTLQTKEGHKKGLEGFQADVDRALGKVEVDQPWKEASTPLQDLYKTPDIYTPTGPAGGAGRGASLAGPVAKTEKATSKDTLTALVKSQRRV